MGSAPCQRFPKASFSSITARDANQLAKVSALLGIVPAVSMLVGIPLGFIGLYQLQRRGQRGMGYAMTGILAGLMWVLLFAALFAGPWGQAP